MEAKQIKLTLKSAAPPLKKITNRFDDDSDDEGICNRLLLFELFLGREFSLTGIFSFKVGKKKKLSLLVRLNLLR